MIEMLANRFREAAHQITEMVRVGKLGARGLLEAQRALDRARFFEECEKEGRSPSPDEVAEAECELEGLIFILGVKV